MDYLHLHDIPFFILLLPVYSTKPKLKLTLHFCDVLNLTSIINLLNWDLNFKYEFTAERK
jgi:hypothetical protein